MLAAADAVVCPADCVSHDAYYRVKRFCKRHGKPCVLLNGSGLSAFARALERVADTRAKGAREPITAVQGPAHAPPLHPRKGQDDTAAW
jgi:hypothetical protein